MKRYFITALFSTTAAMAIYEFLKIIPFIYTYNKIMTWFGLGIILYFLFRKVFSRNQTFLHNENLLQTAVHEWAHTFISILFLNRITSVYVTNQNGKMKYAGKENIFITLAPYCLPWVTYLFIFLRPLINSTSLPYFDVAIGYTLGFHLYCFYKQIHPQQTDIKTYGFLLSIVFILTFLAFNLSIITYSIRFPFWESFLYYFKNVFSDLQALIFNLFALNI